MKMSWQKVVADKRRAQEEAITKFTVLNGDAGSQKIDPSEHSSTSASDKKILHQVARSEISCEALTLSHIEK